MSGRLRFSATMLIMITSLSRASAEPKDYAGIRVVDAGTGRGIPLVELSTVNHLRFVTDNAGRIALNEPELMNTEVYFSVHSHGYELKPDGFGFVGVKLKLIPGIVTEVRMTRKNIAERLCRLTGEGRFRDSLLFECEIPKELRQFNGHVMGQDSVQAAVYRDQIYWFWGDTNTKNYPLGLYRTAGARTPIIKPEFDISAGLPFDYYTDEKTSRVKAMIPHETRKDGVIWCFGVCTVPDDHGEEKLITHYSRRKGLNDQMEHGIAVFDDRRSIFVPVRELPQSERWRFPQGHPVIVDEKPKKWLMFGNSVCNIRVQATLAAVLDPKQYEAFRMNDDGQWTWQKELPPTEPAEEIGQIRAGKIKPENARFALPNANNPKEWIQIHSGSTQWNAHLKRWILIGGQYGGKSSFLGEVWYADADHPTGPFRNAVKILTHDKQSFYNVCHHPFLDRDGGKVIHFEGTYTQDFSGNPDKTPRYNYNQILYRLELDQLNLGKSQIPMK